MILIKYFSYSFFRIVQFLEKITVQVIHKAKYHEGVGQMTLGTLVLIHIF